MMSDPLHISHICLRVDDLDESSVFYTDVLGFEITSPTDETGRSVRMATAHGLGCTLVLMADQVFQREPEHAHIIIQVNQPSKVDEVYDRAVRCHARATRPRDINGSRRITVFDPNGHKLDVIGHSERSRSTSAFIFGTAKMAGSRSGDDARNENTPRPKTSRGGADSTPGSNDRTTRQEPAFRWKYHTQPCISEPARSGLRRS